LKGLVLYRHESNASKFFWDYNQRTRFCAVEMYGGYFGCRPLVDVTLFLLSLLGETSSWGLCKEMLNCFLYRGYLLICRVYT